MKNKNIPRIIPRDCFSVSRMPLAVSRPRLLAQSAQTISLLTDNCATELLFVIPLHYVLCDVDGAVFDLLINLCDILSDYSEREQRYARKERYQYYKLRHKQLRQRNLEQYKPSILNHQVQAGHALA